MGQLIFGDVPILEALDMSGNDILIAFRLAMSFRSQYRDRALRSGLGLCGGVINNSDTFFRVIRGRLSAPATLPVASLTLLQGV